MGRVLLKLAPRDNCLARGWDCAIGVANRKILGEFCLRTEMASDDRMRGRNSPGTRFRNLGKVCSEPLR